MNEVLFMVGPCLGFVAFFAMVFGTFALLRWFRHKEIVTLAEKGLLPEQYARYVSASRNGRGLLGWGITLAMLGLALIIGLWPIGIVEREYILGFGPWMLFGLIPLFIGLALLIFYFVTRKEKASEEEQPPEEASGD